MILIVFMFFTASIDAIKNTSILPRVSSLTFSTPMPTLGAIFIDMNRETYELEIPTFSPESLTHTIIKWNKTETGALQYMQLLCYKKCVGNQLIEESKSDKCFDIKCYSCDCDKPSCEFHGTCCPDISRNDSTENVHLLNISNVTTEHRIETDPQRASHCDSQGVLSLRSCPSQYSNNYIRTKCEKDVDAKDQTLKLFAHVQDNETGSVFFNQYCAMCNHIQQYSGWKLEISCNDYLELYDVLSEDEFLSQALQANDTCYIWQEPSLPGEYRRCEQQWFNEIIDRCNVTGKWETHDPDVVVWCQHQTDIADRVLYSDEDGASFYYKNAFCALCNMQTYPKRLNPCTKNFVLVNINPPEKRPFSILLKLRPAKPVWEEVHPKYSKCVEHREWSSPDGRCLSLHCSPGKLLSGNCTTAVNKVRGLGYKLRIRHVPQKAIRKDIPEFLIERFSDQAKARLHFKSTYLNMYANKLLANISDIVVGNHVSLKIFTHDINELSETERTRGVQSYTEDSDKILDIQWFSMEAYLVADPFMQRDEFEQRILENLVFKEVDLAFDDEKPQILTPELIPWDQEPSAKCDFLRIVFDAVPDVPMEECVYDYGSGLSYLSIHDETNDFNNVLNRSESFLIISPHLTCVFVVFNKTEYNLKLDNATLPSKKHVTLNLNKRAFVFSRPEELNMLLIDHEGKLQVCQSLLVEKFRLSGDIAVAVFSKLNWSQYLLTLILMGVSIACLVLTLMTYSFFSVLRSVAGKNNMLLCATLLLAQIFLLTNPHIRQGHLCTAVGIATHFFWLSMFCWSFICCLHMFRVFRSKTRSIHVTAQSERLGFLKRIIFCLAVPGGIVVVVIVCSLLTSDQERIGYGHSSCYLDSVMLVEISMVCPLGIILLCNCIFFIVTIIQIHSVRKLQAHVCFKKTDRRNLYVYVKLSSITGAFWFIAVIAEAFDYEVLRFVAIILNGCQGLFIFLSYICNKRVAKLYASAVGLEIYPPAKSTSEKGTLTKLVSELNKQDTGLDNTAKCESDQSQDGNGRQDEKNGDETVKIGE